MPPVIAVVIPVYNHREGLRDVVQRALNQCGTIIVVDDGSTDGSADSLEGLPITLVRLPRNGGKGAALLAGAVVSLLERRLQQWHHVGRKTEL